MAMIENLTLKIVENEGLAVATVSYDIVPSQMDLWTQQQYFEVVELIGVDARPEDGQDEPIPRARLRDVFVAIETNPPPRSKLIRLPSSALDEDQDIAHPMVDEIVARVTLSPDRPGVPVSRNSNLVRRGGFVKDKPVAMPA